MSLIPVFDDAGRLRSDAGHQLVAIVHFPQDNTSRQQLLQTIEVEELRAKASGPENHELTKFTKIIQGHLNRGKAARAVAGVVTISLLVLLRTGRVSTQYAAAKMTETIFRAMKLQNDCVFFETVAEGNEIKIIEYDRVVSGRSDIEKSFRKFSSIGHLAAAEFLASEYSPVVPFPQSLNSDIHRRLKTIVRLERAVVDVFPEYFPNPWRIPKPLPREVESAEPFDLSPELRDIFGVETLWGV